MATLTTNLSLTKPATTDFYDIDVQNTNMDLLDTAIAGKAATVHVHPIYGTCSTAASTKAKTVTLSQFSLSSGAFLVVNFTNGNTNTDGATLNVNSTGAKSIYYNGAALDETVLSAGDLAMLLYDGTYWQVMGINTGAGKIQAGSYIGTGTYGSSNPTVLELGLVPKMVIICTADHFKFTTSSSGSLTNYFNHSTIWLQGLTQFKIHDTWNTYTCYVTLEGTTLSWYHTVTSGDYPTRAQLNQSGTEYFYVAFA